MQLLTVQYTIKNQFYDTADVEIHDIRKRKNDMRPTNMSKNALGTDAYYTCMNKEQNSVQQKILHGSSFHCMCMHVIE